MNASELKQGGFFVAGSLLAGLLNYLFQVLAARQLSPDQFAALNGWFADAAVLFLLGGLLQYAANFAPAPRARLRLAVIGFNIASLLLLWRWSAQSGLTFERGLLLVMGSCFLGWLTGQAQIRLAFGVMAVSGVLFALTKVAAAAWPGLSSAPIEVFALGLYAAYLPAIWFLSIYLWKASDPRTPGQPSWAAPFVLSTAAAVIPQFDMVLMNHTQDASVFQDFAHASLFYKGIYFVVFIVAQWLLPKQIHSKTRTPLKSVAVIALGALVASAGLTAVSPFVSQWVLRWPHRPELDLVFWSCLHMSLLTLLFLWIQETCARRRPIWAALPLVILAAEAVLQLIFRLPAREYLIVLTCLQTFVLIQAYRKTQSG